MDKSEVKARSERYYAEWRAAKRRRRWTGYIVGALFLFFMVVLQIPPLSEFIFGRIVVMAW